MSRIEVFKVMAEMRTWPDSEQCIRALLLSTYAVDMFDTPQKFKLIRSRIKAQKRGKK